MTALRQKLIDEQDLRGFSPHSMLACVGAVHRLARHFSRSPDQLTDERGSLTGITHRVSRPAVFRFTFHAPHPTICPAHDAAIPPTAPPGLERRQVQVGP